MSRRNPRFLRYVKAQGYTLVEIMLVLGIISVLVGAGIYYLVGNVDVAKEQRAGNDIKTISTQLQTYEMQNERLPTAAQGLQALVTKPSAEPIPKRWRQLMEKMPTDPWGTPYQYAIPGKRSGKACDLSSFGPDRIQSEDDIGNWVQ